jgi:hypothetical protein
VHRFFAATGRFAVRFRWIVVVAWLAATVLAHLFLPSLASVAKDSSTGFLPASSPSLQAARLATPFQGLGQTPVPVIVARGSGTLTATDLAAAGRLAASLATRTPLALQRWAVALLVRIAQGKVTRYGLPEPDHRMLCAPPTMSDSLLSRLGHGDIVVKPTIDRFDRERVYFTDGSVEQVDAVIYCTGYKISFPFLDEALGGAGDNEVSLYHRVIPPKLPGLYFIGLIQPIGATMPIAEIQSEWVADLLEGRAALPSEPQMNHEIARYRAVTAKRYAGSARHAIQVDFLAYQREIRKERQAGAKRNGVSPAIAVDPLICAQRSARQHAGRFPVAASRVVWGPNLLPNRRHRY